MSSLVRSPTTAAVKHSSQIVLSPLLSGSLLLLVEYAPDRVGAFLNFLTRKLLKLRFTISPASVRATKPILTVLLTFGALRWINQALNTVASNSWRIGASRGWNWSEEVAVVTGGSSGIGASLVNRLVTLGIRVAVLDIQQPPKDMQMNARVKFYHCDVTSSESVARTADSVRLDLGHPTILVNNAGITKPSTILKTSPEYLHKIFGVNLMALWFTTQQFLPQMIQLNKGHVVTIASIASFVALPTAADYSATKAGALSFHEALSCELKHFYKAPNVLATVVHPDFVDTPLIQDFSSRLRQSGVRMLTSDQIANDIITQLKSKKGGQLIIPQSASLISGIRGWPNWLQELLRDAIGKRAAML